MFADFVKVAHENGEEIEGEIKAAVTEINKLKKYLCGILKDSNDIDISDFMNDMRKTDLKEGYHCTYCNSDFIHFGARFHHY